MKEQVLLIYNWAVILLGAACLIHLLTRTLNKEAKTIHGISRWGTDWVSFLIYVWVLFSSLAVFMLIAGQIALLINPDVGSADTLMMAISSIITPLSLIAVIVLGASVRIELPLLGTLSASSVGLPFNYF